ncbi:MAG: histidine triad nucleotide-binding protein [bacterium]|nr:histidine triad nucleotide-binding protein [bacterium]
MSDCVFCKIANGEISRECVLENEYLVAFKDLHPAAPVHVLVIPKKHISSLNDAGETDVTLLGNLLIAAKEVAKKTGVYQRGYRLILNCGEDGGQVIGHLHLHVLGGTKIGRKGEEL